MSIFKQMRVQGFRRLHDVDLKLKPLNVLIGANGSGKTTLLDVFSLLAASASGNLKSTISAIGGVDGNLTALTSRPSDTIHFELDTSGPDSPPLKYTISLKPSGMSYEISDESLIQYTDSPKFSSRTHVESIHGQVCYFNSAVNHSCFPVEDNSLESALSQIHRTFEEPEKFRKQLASSTHYHALDVSQRAPVRLPQPMREAHLPGKDGEDLVSCLYWMRETQPDQFETIEDTLRVGFPNFDRLNFPPVAAGMLGMTWKENSFTHPFYMHQLSEGTLRFLWLVTLLYSPGLTEVTLLDEPEVSLHPELLSVLADCMREASQRTQLIVATHADRLVRFLKPEEVIAIDIEDDGVSTATRADELDLDAWLEEYTLDQVWQHGRMGARS